MNCCRRKIPCKSNVKKIEKFFFPFSFEKYHKAIRGKHHAFEKVSGKNSNYGQNSNDNRGKKGTKFKSFTQRGLTISRHLNTERKYEKIFFFIQRTRYGQDTRRN